MTDTPLKQLQQRSREVFDKTADSISDLLEQAYVRGYEGYEEEEAFDIQSMLDADEFITDEQWINAAQAAINQVEKPVILTNKDAENKSKVDVNELIDLCQSCIGCEVEKSDCSFTTSCKSYVAKDDLDSRYKVLCDLAKALAHQPCMTDASCSQAQEFIARIRKTSQIDSPYQIKKKLQAAKEEGYQEGYQAGSSAFGETWNNGYEAGKEAGLSEGANEYLVQEATDETNEDCIREPVCVAHIDLEFCTKKCLKRLPTIDLISKSKLLDWIIKTEFVVSGIFGLIQVDSLIASISNGDFDIERNNG